MRIIKIGKDIHNDIAINDSFVSKFHCQIMQDDNGRCRIADLGSTNGTYVNGMRIYGEKELSPSDVVRVGNSTPPWQNYIAGPGGVSGGMTSNGGVGFGIAALSCGVAGLIFFAIIFGPVAIIFGGISMHKKERLKGLGIAGLVLGIIDTVVGIILVATATSLFW